MCNRYGLHSPLAVLQDVFEFLNGLELEPRYNVAPGQDIVVVRLDSDGRREAVVAHWGMPLAGRPAPVLNARAETVASGPAFREAVRRGRVLVPANGFYEWRQEGPARQPYYFEVANRPLFAMAGLVDPETHGVIITTSANSDIADVHDRMPVIVPAERYGEWLGEGAAKDPKDLLRRMPKPRLRRRPVDTAVNDARHEGPDLLKPAVQGRLF